MRAAWTCAAQTGRSFEAWWCRAAFLQPAVPSGSSEYSSKVVVEDSVLQRGPLRSLIGIRADGRLGRRCAFSTPLIFHLDSPLRSQALRDPDRARRLHGASRLALTRLVNAAIDEDVAALLLAGDIFDNEVGDVTSRASP